ncbi:hypothetical protein EW146_g2816 [Bondarzewia mesenterica]|uniref:Uncharacterized protein n=1 Tax=Bondarzewia mesenterica TaxID=1095465 RepID=A0A4S4M009_9AGAM|nr:hypothetical protein EW146_g2816 [Bondarzewia mesenterica]
MDDSHCAYRTHVHTTVPTNRLKESFEEDPRLQSELQFRRTYLSVPTRDRLTVHDDQVPSCAGPLCLVRAREQRFDPFQVVRTRLPHDQKNAKDDR